jgi:hypothetical protein
MAFNNNNNNKDAKISFTPAPPRTEPTSPPSSSEMPALERIPISVPEEEEERISPPISPARREDKPQPPAAKASSQAVGFQAVGSDSRTIYTVMTGTGCKGRKEWKTPTQLKQADLKRKKNLSNLMGAL